MFRSIKIIILLLNGLTTVLGQFQGTYDLDSDYSHVRKEPKMGVNTNWTIVKKHSVSVLEDGWS